MDLKFALRLTVQVEQPSSGNIQLDSPSEVHFAHLQLESARRPPMTGPIAEEIAQTIPKIPKNKPRSASGTRSATTISTEARIPPPPMPATVRPAIILDMFCDAPQTADPTAKVRIEDRRMYLRPKTSASPAKIGMKTVEDRA